jgi:hypothetical protein
MKEQAHLHLPLKMTLEHLAQDVNQFFSWRMGLDSVVQVIHENENENKTSSSNNKGGSACIEINLTEALKIKSGYKIRIYLSLTASGLSIVSLPVHEEHGWNLGIRALEYVGWINNATHMTYGNKTKAFSLSHFLAYPVLGSYAGEHNAEKWLQDLDEEQELSEQLDMLYEKKMDSQIEQSFLQLLKNNDLRALNGKINEKIGNRLIRIKTQITDNHLLHHSLKSMMARLTDAQESIEHKADLNTNHDNIGQKPESVTQSQASSVKIKKFYQKFNKKSRYENEELLMNPLNVLSAFFYNVDDTLGDRMARHISFNNKENFVLPIHQYWKKAINKGDANIKNHSALVNNNNDKKLPRKKLPELLDNVFSANISTSMKQTWSKSKLKLQEKMPSYYRLFQKGDKNAPFDLSNRNEKHLASLITPAEFVMDDFMEDVELSNHSHERKAQVIEFLNKQQKIKIRWKRDNIDCFYGNPLRAAITHSNYKLALWLAQNPALIVDTVDLKECIKPIYVREKWFAQVNMPLLCLLFTTIHHQINKKHLQALLVLLLTSNHQDVKGDKVKHNVSNNSYNIDENINTVSPLKKDSRGLDSLDIILHSRAISKKDKVCYLKMMIKVQPELKEAVLLKLKLNEKLGSNLEKSMADKDMKYQLNMSEKMRSWLKTELENE